MKRVLLVCNDTVGHKMAGPAIRCMELAKAMANDFDVVVSAQNLDVNYRPPVRLCNATPKAVAQEANQADVVVVQGDALRRYPALLKTPAALIADLYCPIPLEYHLSSQNVPQPVRLEQGWYVAQLMQQQLFYADYFLCASERQLDFWVGALTMAGRINALSMPDGARAGLEHLIACVPFGMPDSMPEPNGHPLRDKFGIPHDEFVMVWGGGIYEWFDPLTIIRAVGLLAEQGLRTHLVFMGVKHPNPGIAEHDRVGASVKLARELGLLDSLVHFNFDWVDYWERHTYLLDADVGVSAHLNNAETRYSFRTRMLDYLWCGLPILATEGDTFGELVCEKNLGIAMRYESVEDWTVAIRQMAANPAFRLSCKAAVMDIRGEYAWPRVAEPLIRACASLAVSADRNYARRRAAQLRLGAEAAFPSILSRVRSVYARHGASGLVSVISNKLLKRSA